MTEEALPQGGNPYLRAINALNASGVPYVIVGGFAVVMHGSNRFTPDMNVAIDLSAMSIQKLQESFQACGIETSRSIPYDALNDESAIQSLKDKFGLFFSFGDSQAPSFSVEIFIESPIPFKKLSRDSLNFDLNGESAKICSLEHLVEMKSRVGRPQDKLDVENLSLVQRAEKVGWDNLESSEDSSFQSDQKEILASFSGMTHGERLQWLGEMLENVGRFCIV